MIQLLRFTPWQTTRSHDMDTGEDIPAQVTLIREFETWEDLNAWMNFQPEIKGEFGLKLRVRLKSET